MSLDTRTQIDLIGAITEKASFEITFEHFEDDETTPEIPPGDWELTVTSDESGKKILAHYEETTGFDKSENKLIWKRNASENSLPYGRHFYFVNQTIGEERFLIYYGELGVNHNTNLQ